MNAHIFPFYSKRPLIRSIKVLLWLLLLGTVMLRATPLDRRINISFQKTPLKDALDMVAQKAAFEWSYNAKLFDANRRVSLLANDWTVREVLRELLGETFAYAVSGNYLIIKKQKKPGEQLSGYIKDPYSGQRIANATVYDRRTLRATTTDTNGYYELKVKKMTELVVAKLDFRDTVILLSPQTPRFQNINLEIVQSPAHTHRVNDVATEIKSVSYQLERAFRASLDHWAMFNVPDSLHRHFQISFLPMVGTNHILSAKVANDWSVNVLAGVSNRVQTLEVAGLGNFTRSHVDGLQMAGLFNELRGSTTGVQIAGLYNRTGDSLSGIQLSGFVNIARHVEGHSMQASGFLNIAAEGTIAVQASGFMSRADRVSFVQISGFANSAHTVEGVQAAGFLNQAKRVRGIQIGLFNSARNLKGLQIGLLNRSGRRVLPFFNWG